MFIIIAGGGKIGYNLLKDRLNKMNEVVIIEKCKRKYQSITEEFGSLAVPGDACDPGVLEKAGINRAEMIIACTGQDQDNLIICQMARKKFRVPNTIALVNNPENESVFHRLGVDIAVNTIEGVLQSLEVQLAHLGNLTVLAKYNGTQLIEARLTADSQASGKTLEQLNIPGDCEVLALVRGGVSLKTEPSTTVKSDDRLLILAPGEFYQSLKAELIGDDSP